MGDVLKTGYLNYSQKKVLKNQWSTKFFALVLVVQGKPGIHLYGFQDQEAYNKYERDVRPLDAEKRHKMTKAVTQIQINHIKLMEKVLFKQQDALEATTDSGKKFTFIAEQQGFNCAESWLSTYKCADAQLQSRKGQDCESMKSDTLSMSSTIGDSESETSSMLIGVAENEIYESVDKGVSYPIIIQETEVSNRLGLTGTYDLQINTRNITLVDQKTQKGLYVWPYRYLRRYGRNKTEFSFECGRRSSTGQGYFKFFTLQGNDIFWQVESMAKAIRASERENSLQGPFKPESAQLNQSISKKPSVKNHHQNDFNEIQQNLNQVPTDPVYAEPVKKSLLPPQSPKSVAEGCVYHYADATPVCKERSSAENKPPIMPDTSRPPIPSRSFLNEPREAACVADPDYEFIESEYAYASAEDVKRERPWLKEEKFAIEQLSDDYTC